MRSNRTRKLIIALVTTFAVLTIAGTAIARPGRDHAQLTVQVAENGFDFVMRIRSSTMDSLLTAMRLSRRGTSTRREHSTEPMESTRTDPPSIRTRCSVRGPATALRR